MTGLRMRAIGLPMLAAALVLAATGCGAGGFGSDEPTTLDTSISTYVALGDGFTAAPYIGKATTEDGCLRSEGNYPSLVAKALGVNKVTDVSCLGATTRSITEASKAQGTGKKLPPQIDAVNKDTDLITIGVGIEDRKLLPKLFRICMALPCGKYVAAAPLISQIKLFGENLTRAVRDMQDIAPKSYIVLLGYPQIPPLDDTCKRLPAMTAPQLDAANILLGQLNQQIQSAARQTGAAYINVAALSADHSACAEVPWVNGFQGTKGEAEPFHPVAAEQTAVADAIAAQVRAR